MRPSRNLSLWLGNGHGDWCRDRQGGESSGANGVSKQKQNVYKSLDKMKVRPVALGFSLIKGIDFHEVFSPTSRQESFRLLVSIMVSKVWKERSLDVTSAFLNGDL